MMHAYQHMDHEDSFIRRLTRRIFQRVSILVHLRDKRKRVSFKLTMRRNAQHTHRAARSRRATRADTSVVFIVFMVFKNRRFLSSLREDDSRRTRHANIARALATYRTDASEFSHEDPVDVW